MVAQESVNTATAPKPLPASDLQDLAALNKAASDSLRLHILRVLRQASYNVMELCTLLDVRQPTLSHHLKILATAGLVTSRREGTTLFYRRTATGLPEPLTTLARQLFQAADALPLPVAIQQRIHAVQAERASSSLTFFRENAHRFRAQQELIATHAHYDEAVLSILDRDTTPRHRVVEVGPGEGDFLPYLSERFETVRAVDNAETMLAQARQQVTSRALTNVTCVLGEPRDEPAGEADCVVVNMVLHHVAAPGALIADCARLLRPDGLLLISELCPHEQTWTRDACGDLWLGLDPADLSDWAADADLTEDQSAYLALRNGFRVQVRAFRRPAPPSH